MPATLGSFGPAAVRWGRVGSEKKTFPLVFLSHSSVSTEQTLSNTAGRTSGRGDPDPETPFHCHFVSRIVKGNKETLIWHLYIFLT